MAQKLHCSNVPIVSSPTVTTAVMLELFAEVFIVKNEPCIDFPSNMFFSCQGCGSILTMCMFIDTDKCSWSVHCTIVVNL